jgi:hypothetical protein
LKRHRRATRGTRAHKTVCHSASFDHSRGASAEAAATPFCLREHRRHERTRSAPIRAIVDAVHELGLVGSGTVELRVHQLAPLFKAFILNREELFIGFYPVVRRQVKLRDEPHDVYDLMGKDGTLFHHALTRATRP